MFIEVKTRTSKFYGEPIDAVDINKQKHIIKSSNFFIYKYNLINEYIRFDIIEIYIDKEKYSINHIKDVFY